MHNLTGTYCIARKILKSHMGKADFPLDKHLAPTWSDLENLAEVSDQVENNNKLEYKAIFRSTAYLKRKKTHKTLKQPNRLFSCTKKILSNSNLICSQYFLNFWMATTHLQWFNNKMVLLIQAVICCHFYTKWVLFWGSAMSFLAKTGSPPLENHHCITAFLFLCSYFCSSITKNAVCCVVLFCTFFKTFSLTHCQCLSYLTSDVCTPQKNWGFR